MKRIFIVCMLCFSLLLVSPAFVHGEGEELPKKNANGLLFDTLQNVGEGVKSTTQSIETAVEETVTNTVTSTDQVVTSIVGSVKNDAGHAILENATETIIKTVEHTTTEVTSTIDSVVNELPVVSVVDEVKAIGKQTTTEVVNTIDKTVDPIVDKLPPVPVVTPLVKETISAVRLDSVLAGESKSQEPVVETVETNTVQINTGNENSYLEEESAIVAVPAVEIADSVNKMESVTEKMEGILDKPVIIPDDTRVSVAESILQELPDSDSNKIIAPQQKSGTSGDSSNFTTGMSIGEENRKTTPPFNSEKNLNHLSVSAITTFTSSTASLPLLISGHNDLSFGVVVDVFSLITSNGRQWMPPDEKAMIQWIHAPPGQPPKQTPFFNVNQTL
ncbi:hypothetical protein [Sporosarcina sp. JAI121]|uniref:hypothetical protein n=1 Tax=Sporosarcina sp. JAI121 TaxID=2723064 RepID=UPI0015CAE8FE|nr:hypothetical protein [Sporosarcina sp. JAI121]NYF23812.1 hypothetical protein [Sporosarcina sp. JAI121]